MSLRVLVLVWSLCFGGALAVSRNSAGPLRLWASGGGSRCQGELQVLRGGRWIGAATIMVPESFGLRLCAALDCGPLLSMKEGKVPEREAVYLFTVGCDSTSLTNCLSSDVFQLNRSLELNCSDSVRLASAQPSCSGSLLIKDQSLDQSWTPVCEGALDRRGAEVVCRELDCGPPLLQGALSPLGQMFHCEGHESALMNCPRNRTRTEPGTCSSLHLTCSEPVRLVGGPSRCEGTLEVKHGRQWRGLVTDGRWDLQSAAGVCQVLDCGSALSTEKTRGFNETEVWAIVPDCEKKAPLRDCVVSGFSAPGGVDVVCSGQQGAAEETQSSP